MNEKECCEECLKCPDYTKHDFCHNKSCACHTPQEKEPWITSQERADLIKSVEKCKPIFERAGKVPTEKEPWEFVNKIASYLRCDCDECRGAIEKHIKSLLDTQREEIVKEVEGMRKDESEYTIEYWNGYNEALDTVIEKIKNK